METSSMTNPDRSGNEPNHVYLSLWKQFKGFIDEKLPHVGRRETDYLTKDNVSLFYRDYVKYSRISPQSVKRYKWALQFYMKRMFTNTASRFFVDDCEGVEEAIQFQMREYNASQIELDKDPHAKVPTDTLMPAENIHAMKRLISMNAHYW